jgi:GNAT superfamily N-acetyltransferase
MTWHAGAALAKRIEYAEAVNGAVCAQRQAGSAVEWFGSGCAIFAGAGSPLTHAIGIGMDGLLPAGELTRVEEFFVCRGALPVIDLCPLADPGLIESLGQRGYRITEFNNVMARLVADPLPPPPAGIGIRLATSGEVESWSTLLAQGFLDRDDVTAEELLVGRALFDAPGSASFWALVDSEPVAAGAASTHGGFAMLYADSTRSRYRMRGAQLALIAARLDWARAQGCEVAAASVLPGSGSQRNYERLGFRVCYTKSIMTAARPPGPTLT